MATGGTPRRDSPVALSDLFDDALRQLEPPKRPATSGGAPAQAAPLNDGFLYSGNRHESVPRALFLDRRLTPLERNAWQVFRLQLNDDGVTALPTYQQLRPYLASMPCATQASHETVARALTLLRLTRWMSLVRRLRDQKTGRILGNLYVLHDEPLTPFEAMQLDPDYLGLVSQALTHAAKAVQIVGVNTLREIDEDPMLNGRALPTRLQVLAQRMAQSGWTNGSGAPVTVGHDSEEGQDGALPNVGCPSSESEAGSKPSSDGLLRNPKADCTVRMVHMNQLRTVPHEKAAQRLRLPERLLRLKDEQQSGALVALQQVDECSRQAVLDEWDARCCDSAVRNPAGYLFGIIQKAIRGEFRAWAAQLGLAHSPPEPLSPGDSGSAPSTREVARRHLAQLREKLRQG